MRSSKILCRVDERLCGRLNGQFDPSLVLRVSTTGEVTLATAVYMPRNQQGSPFGFERTAAAYVLC